MARQHLPRLRVRRALGAYSFSFARHPAWGRFYARQPEIQDYACSLADRFGVRERIVTGADVLAADGYEDGGRWRIRTSRGDWSAQALISATGPWSEPVLPQVPGLERFAGEVFHSSRWNHDHDLTAR